jgi:hypothetical protein
VLSPPAQRRSRGQHPLFPAVRQGRFPAWQHVTPFAFWLTHCENVSEQQFTSDPEGQQCGRVVVQQAAPDPAAQHAPVAGQHELADPAGQHRP